MMFKNVGASEIKLRVFTGIALMVAGFGAPLPEEMHLAAMSIAVPVLFTAALGFCPLKALLLRKTS